MAKPSSLNPLGYVVERQYRDSVVLKNKYFKGRLAKARNLYRKDLLAHYGCVNAIEFSADGNLLVSGGDDRRVLLWSVPEAMFGKGSPMVMENDHRSNIFCLAFDSGNTKIFSGGNDDQVIIHDAVTAQLVGKLVHKKPVYGLSIHPQNDSVLATAGDDGKILLFDVRESLNSDAVCMAKQKTGFHSVMFNPSNPRYLATANSDDGIGLWDIRKPKEIAIHYDERAGKVSGISACFNSAGSKILALRRRLPPVLYNTHQPDTICQFYHPQYYNSCTMKTCCFAGDNDEYVLSGSDDFNLYMWKTPGEESVEWGRSHMVLKGHRSIVNQVRYNKVNNLIATSGVEKMVKLWSSIPVGTWQGSLQKEYPDSSRTVYTHDDYMYLVGHTGERISHDYSDQSIQEDTKMMAFFDSLIQREIEGWNSSSERSELSDSDSDGQERNFNSLLKEMYSNGKISHEDSKKQKTNIIAQLIAKRRNRLARMAHERSSSALRSHAKDKPTKRKHKDLHKSKSATTKSKINGSGGSSGGGGSSSSSNLRQTPPRRSPTPEREVFKRKIITEAYKLRKYRTRQSLRELFESDDRAIAAAASTNSNNNNTSGSNNNNCSLDAPSTSTGITSSHNSALYRVIEQDSDEDVATPNAGTSGGDGGDGGVAGHSGHGNGNCSQQVEEGGVVEENNFVSILPTPLNGTHDMIVNVLEMTSSASGGGGGGGGGASGGANGNVVTVINEEYNGASTSNGSHDCSNSDCNENNANEEEEEGDEDELASTSSGHVTERRSGLRRQRFRIDSFTQTNSTNNSNNNNNIEDSDSDSEYEYNYRTPVKKRRTTSASDSGCGTGPSTGSPHPTRNSSRNHHQQCSSNDLYNNECTFDDDFSFEKFMGRVNRARIRKQIAADSDSN